MISIEQAVERALKNTQFEVTADWKGLSPSPAKQSEVLVVDDDMGVRQTLTLLLTAAGYKTSAAKSGFEALLIMKKQPPALLLCDLDMPDMSGRELVTIVRRRFPSIAVIAMSSSFEGENTAVEVMADAFYGKGQNNPSELLQIAAETIQRAERHDAEKTLVWARRIGTDTTGTSFALITCTDCLRPFMVVMPMEDMRLVQVVRCGFCKSEIQYISEKSNAKQNLGDLFSLLGERRNSFSKAMGHAAK